MLTDFKRKILYINDVEQLTGFHRSTLRRKWKKDQFPKPILLDSTRLIWHIDTINQWIEETFSKESTGYDIGGDLCTKKT